MVIAIIPRFFFGQKPARADGRKQKGPPSFRGRAKEKNSKCGLAVVANGFHWTAFFGFLAAAFFLGGLGLFAHNGITAVFVAAEIIGGGFAAQVAVNALGVHEIFSGHVLWVSICWISHKILFVAKTTAKIMASRRREASPNSIGTEIYSRSIWSPSPR
jgi:hypothetical protein